MRHSVIFLLLFTLHAAAPSSRIPQAVLFADSVRPHPGGNRHTADMAGIFTRPECARPVTATNDLAAAARPSESAMRGHSRAASTERLQPTSSLGPSVVSVSGRQLVVRKRNPDGTLGPAAPYILRGVAWSPVSTTTPASTAARRLEFGIWAATDISLIRDMNANTVYTFLDPGLDDAAMGVLDQLYDNGIMVVLTVDDGINDMTRVQQAVAFYKDHPAVLAWMLGNEWNINRYFTSPPISVLDAAQRTQAAAALIKTLDMNHPVATSYGDIDIGAPGLRLAYTQNYVNNVCPSVDLWALNIYRGNTLGTLFEQWRLITPKPMMLGEFGTDAFRSAGTANPPPGAEDGAMQKQWGLSAWDHLFKNLSALNPSNVAIGGCVFAWNDEWWKVPPSGSQQTAGCGPPDCSGHPDSFSNEEYYGIVALDPANVTRLKRPIYDALKDVFDPAYQPAHAATYRAVSRGASAEEYRFQYGVAWFFEDGASFYRATGAAGGGRGFNVAAIDPCTGELIEPVQHFDTYTTRLTGAALCEMTSFLDGLPDGTLILMAVADEAGLNAFPPNGCTHLTNACIEPFFETLEALGSQQIRNYCYWNSWAMATVKGEGAALAEQLADAAEASAEATIPIPATISPMWRAFSASAGNGTIRVDVPDGCTWTAVSNDPSFITITTGAGGAVAAW
jgi:hypothetical protein